MLPNVWKSKHFSHDWKILHTPDLLHIVVAKWNWVQGHADDTQKFICPHFSPDFTQSPRSSIRNGTGEESTAYNMVTKKKHFHICLCSAPFCTDSKRHSTEQRKFREVNEKWLLNPPYKQVNQDLQSNTCMGVKARVRRSFGKNTIHLDLYDKHFSNIKKEAAILLMLLQ